MPERCIGGRGPRPCRGRHRVGWHARRRCRTCTRSPALWGSRRAPRRRCPSRSRGPRPCHPHPAPPRHLSRERTCGRPRELRALLTIHPRLHASTQHTARSACGAEHSLYATWGACGGTRTCSRDCTRYPWLNASSEACGVKSVRQHGGRCSCCAWCRSVAWGAAEGRAHARTQGGAGGAPGGWRSCS